LVRLYKNGIAIIIGRIVHNESATEDLSQETFRIALEKIRDGDVREPERLSGFICGVARNIAIEYVRRMRRLVNQEEVGNAEQIPDPHPDQFEQLWRKERAEIVRQVLNEMKVQRDSDVIFRFFIADEDGDTICADLGLTKRQFSLILYRALRRYRELYIIAVSGINERAAEIRTTDRKIQVASLINLELTIDKPYINFTSEDQEHIIAELKELLDQSSPIKVVTVRPGSTKLTIEITYKQAEQILWLYRRGLLKELNITDVQLIGNAAAAALVQHKVKERAFDVFLCHNSADKPEVKRIARELLKYGLLPWLDEWELQPGLPWQDSLERQIETIKSAAVFVGMSGVGPWQDLELNAFLRQFVYRKCPVIPVILRGCETIPRLPVFLDGMTWVNFNKRKPNPVQQLFWGITGERLEVDLL
jgi:RNA polymerase sigma factor (sigma-70 family)